MPETISATTETMKLHFSGDLHASLTRRMLAANCPSLEFGVAATIWASSSSGCFSKNALLGASRSSIGV